MPGACAERPRQQVLGSRRAGTNAVRARLPAMTMPVNDWFGAATAGVLVLIAEIPVDTWQAPGLGGWTVRELVAHTRRSWTLIGTYLAEPEPGAVDVGTAASYFAMGLVQPGVHAGILARGQDDAAALGHCPVACACACHCPFLPVLSRHGQRGPARRADR